MAEVDLSNPYVVLYAQLGRRTSQYCQRYGPKCCIAAEALAVETPKNLEIKFFVQIGLSAL